MPRVLRGILSYNLLNLGKKYKIEQIIIFIFTIFAAVKHLKNDRKRQGKTGIVGCVSI